MEIYYLDNEVFRHLKDMEDAAIPRRREILEVEVRRQRVREEYLQKNYADTKFELAQHMGKVNSHQIEEI